MEKKRVAVFFGGRSNEHDISVITGMLACNLLRGANFEVMPVYLTRENQMTAAERARGVSDFAQPSFPPVFLRGRALYTERKPKKVYFPIDVALNCCHGGYGEDGTLAALLAFHGVKTASPNMPVSAVFMDKWLTKIALRGLGIPTADGVRVTEKEWYEQRKEMLARVQSLGYPVIIKPLLLGSSIGIRVAHSEEELPAALEYAYRVDDGALVERYLTGKRDINCAAAYLRGEYRFSALEEVFSGGDILSFGEKYQGEAKPPVLPAEVSREQEEKIKGYLNQILSAFSVRGVVRADFILAEGKVYFSELNVVPGSLAAYLFSENLSGAKEFLCALVEEGARPRTQKGILNTRLLSQSVFGAKGAKNR